MTKKVFGLTGGIGTGKSTVAKILQKKYSDIVIFDCDEQAKKVAEESEIKNELKKIWGENKEIIFEDQKKKKEVEKLIHPKVWQKLDETIDKADDKKMILVESAILFEIGKDKDMVKNLITVCSPEERKKRIKNRNSWSEEEINLRIKNQFDQDLLKKKANVVIDTGCSLNELEDKTEKLHQYLLKPTEEKLIL